MGEVIGEKEGQKAASSWKQFTILMRKNYIATKRNKWLTLAQVIAPFMFVLILYLMTHSMETMGAKAPEYRSVTIPDESAFPVIPKFKCRHAFGPCYSLAYTPNITQMVENVAIRSGLKASDLIGFESEYALDDYLVAHPWSVQGAYLFIEWENGVWEYAIQYNSTSWGSVSNLLATHPAELVAMPMAAMMDNEILKQQLRRDNASNADSFSYTLTNMQLPQLKSLNSGFLLYMYPTFFLAAIMLNFVVMVRGMVQEKELRLKEGMRMMGLKELPYWASCQDVYVLWTSFFLIISGHIFDLTIIVLFFLFLIFGQSMIAFGFLLASLQKRSVSSTTIGFVIWVISASVFSVLNPNLYANGKPAIIANIISLFSPFAFSKGMFDLSFGVVTHNVQHWSQRNEKVLSDTFWLEKAYLYMILDTFLYLIIAAWITQVFPGEFGVPKKPYFFLQPTYWTGKTSRRQKAHRSKLNPVAIVSDEDVIAEDTVVKSGAFPADTCVVLDDLMKVYTSGFAGRNKFMAVKGISLTMQNNQLFCLLGPNGAGKTTTFSMLNGMFPSSGGDATIFGYSIVDEMDKIRSLMGVCPQHDLLWDEMTGMEHLLFFCRFKNIPESEVKEVAATRLDLVGLTNLADVPTSHYSGGEKRRLSVALATVGDPRIIFLDEPTTGMDPVSRRQVWEIISEAKKGRVVILTTHSMEEADVLSDRIGIVAHGQLRCLGTNISLKNKFGTGYHINLFHAIGDGPRVTDNVRKFVTTHLPEWDSQFENMQAHQSHLSVTVPYSEAPRIPVLLQALEDNIDAMGVEEITMNLSSLEEVFLKIAMESQQETSVSIDEIGHFSDELEKMVQATSRDTKAETPLRVQTRALLRKHVNFYRHSYSTIIAQLAIPLIFMIVLLVSGFPNDFKYEDNPHPAILPPPTPWLLPWSPREYSVPYYQDPSIPSSVIGSYRGNTSGFLDHIDFSILNATLSSGELPDSLGVYTNFTFPAYQSEPNLFGYLRKNTERGWLGALVFHEFDMSSNHYAIGIVHNITQRGAQATVGTLNLLDNAMLRMVTNGTKLVVRLKEFPNWNHTVKLPGGYVEPIWALLGCSFFMVALLSLIVREKEERLRYLLEMAGMSMKSYWLTLFSLGLIFYFVVVLFFYALGFLFQQPLFTLNAPLPLALAFLVFAFGQVGFSFFLSTFTDSASNAALGGYIYILFFVLITQSLNPLIVDLADNGTYYGVTIFPHFGLSLIMNSVKSYYFPTGENMTMSDFNHNRMRFIFLIMFFISIAFYVLHQYFEAIFPSQYGIAKKPWFLFMKSTWSRKKNTIQVQPASGFADVPMEPTDIATERSNAMQDFSGANKFPLAVPGISKSFKTHDGNKFAVDQLALAINPLECFGLLGPNGGGKTTLVNILSGLYPTTSGDAAINGHSVVTDLAAAQRHMGVCPQDSVFWSEMTAREHLMLFGSMRNLRGDVLRTAVDLALRQVLLSDAADRPAGGYSGGMKRRLSLAIALIGTPSVVFLDEPSTGVDPFSRRVVWDVIHAHKRHCSILLTTHNMEEAEVLCDRVAMVDKGRMTCVGRPVELKTRYGAGYTLHILHKEKDSHNIEQFVTTTFASSSVVDTMPGSVIFSLPKGSTKLSTLFAALQFNTEALGIKDWALLQSNLEDVLLASTGGGAAEK